jgi:hypothetical protein
MDKRGRRGMLRDRVIQATRFDLPMLLSERNYGSCDARAERGRRGGRGAWPCMPSKLVEVVSSASPRRARTRGLGGSCMPARGRASTRLAHAEERVLTGRAARQCARIARVAGACARVVRGASRVVTACRSSRAQARSAKWSMGGRSAPAAGDWLKMKIGRHARPCRTGGLGAPGECKSGGRCAPGGFRTGGLCAPVGSKEP